MLFLFWNFRKSSWSKSDLVLEVVCRHLVAVVYLSIKMFNGNKSSWLRLLGIGSNFMWGLLMPGSLSQSWSIGPGKDWGQKWPFLYLLLSKIDFVSRPWLCENLEWRWVEVLTIQPAIFTLYLKIRRLGAWGDDSGLKVLGSYRGPEFNS